MTTTSKYTSIFQCACDGGACFLGPAKRCEVVLPGSQRRLHAVGGEVTEMEGCEAMLRGPPPPGEGDLLPDKNTFIFKERSWTDCIVWEKGTALTADVQRSLGENHF